MIEQIRAYAEKYHMLEQSDRIIAGISGGADSVCLLFVLMELQKEIGFSIHAVHVHHGLRGEEADRDAQYVKELTEKYGISCEIYWYDVELEAKKRKQSKEEAGRDIRREVFCRVMQEQNATKIALAHHRDDNAETFLMNLARGSGLSGLSGIRPAAGAFIRPLLCVSRRKIEAYLKERQIEYCTDATNYEDDYTRNRIRNHIIPYLEENVNPAAVMHMNEAMEQIRKAGEYMEVQAEKELNVYTEVRDSGIFIREELMQEVPEVIREMVCHKVLKIAAGHEKDIGKKHVKFLLELFGKKTGSRLSCPYGVTGVRRSTGILLGKNTEVKKNGTEQEYRLVPGEEILAEGLCIRTKVIENPFIKCPNVPENIYTKWFDYDIIKNNAIIRKRRPGDYLVIDEKGNRQKLKSYFINEKIPQEERDNILLAAQGSCILWVIGYRMGYTARITEKTKYALEIKIHGGKKDGRDC